MKSIAMITFLSVMFVSCTKDKSEKGCGISATSIAGTYKVTAVTYKATPGAAETDYFTTFFADDCERDDIVTFNANGTFVVDDAGIVCTPSGESGGNWSVSGNTLIMDDGPMIDGDEYTITEFDCQSKLVITFNDYDADNDQVKITFTRQ
jgi:Lipocalin-like domain